VFETESAQILDKADALCEKAETKHQWSLLVEANALRDRGETKEKSC
jgi:hypothetical protein